jgi:hypothetical protein
VGVRGSTKKHLGYFFIVTPHPAPSPLTKGEKGYLVLKCNCDTVSWGEEILRVYFLSNVTKILISNKVNL